MGLGRALSGTWVALLVAALVAATALLAAHTSCRSLKPGLRWRPVAWGCASIAFLNIFAWSLLIPPFEGRDEADHFAYVAQIAENAALPTNGQENGIYSPQETLVLRGLHYGSVALYPQTPAISSLAEQRALMRDVHAGASRQGSGEAGVATAEPPLYYALQTIPYFLARGNILTQLQLMRALGALLGALTALLVLLTLREMLPRSPWAVVIGGVCIALQPMFAFVSGSVNPDALVLTIATAVFFCITRAFRRGLTRRSAVALGILIAVGFATKLTFDGFALGVFFGLAMLGVREIKTTGWRALTSPAIAAGIGISPLLLYMLRNTLLDHPTLGILSGGAGIASETPLNELSYIWQMYLPRVPGMTHYFVGISTYKDIWFDRFVGFYGWMDTTLPTRVDNAALIPAAAVAFLCGREVLARRQSLVKRLPELATYLAMAVGILVMVGASSYVTDAIQHRYAFGEPRYLLPLLPLLGAVIALAVRGAGRRWVPIAGAALVVLIVGHDIFSQLQVIARYYG